MLNTWRLKRKSKKERRGKLAKAKRDLKKLLADFLGQKPNLSQLLELFVATNNPELRKRLWNVIEKYRQPDANDLVDFLGRVSKDYKDRYWNLIVSLDPPPDTYRSIIAIYPDFRVSALNELLKLISKISRLRAKSILRSILSIQEVSSQIWTVYKKMGLTAEDLSDIVSDKTTPVPRAIRDEAEAILLSRRVVEYSKTQKILDIFRGILKVCREIEILENQKKK